MNKKTLAIVLLSLLALTSIGVIAISISGPNITPLGTNRPTIEDEIVCSWTPSADTFTQNITWINGSVIHSGPTQLANTTNQSSLNPGIAHKGEEWTCNISSSNQTHNTWRSTTFSIKNALPTLPNATEDTLYEDQTYLNTIQSTDPDGDSILYSLLGNIPSYCSLGTISGALSCTPLAAHIGAVNVTFYADDGGNYTAKNKVTYTILEVNDPPTLSITDPNATEDITYNLTIDASDEESNYPLNFTIDTNLSSLILYNNSQNEAYITFNRENNAPSYLDRGTWYVIINATDTGPSANTPYDNPFVSETIIVEVSTVNGAPNITTNLSSINATQGDFLNFSINTSDRDLEDNISFSISSSCGISNPWTIHTINGSSNATGQVNQTITNDHIICRDVTITASDGEDTDQLSITLNLTNTNDAPTLYQVSNVLGNTGGDDITNLSAIKGLSFYYRVNVTDPDVYTYEGEDLSYSDNSTLFNINSAGIISFTPQDADVGNYSILINISDDGQDGSNPLWSSQVMELEILNNTIPNLYPIGDQSCDEDALCQITITAYDPDNGDTLSFSSNNTALFNVTKINSTSAQTSYTPINGQVGNYTISVSVNDQHDTEDTETFTFSINNVNDAPIIDQNSDGNPDSISTPLSVEDHTTTFRVNITDEDLDIGLDNITFNYSFTQDDYALENNLSMNTYQDYAIYQFTPNSTQTGNFTINISARDTAGEVAWQEINFTVHTKGTAPVINTIKPYSDGNNITQTGFISTAGYMSNDEEVNFSENMVVTYDAQSSYDTSIPSNSVNYKWYVDGTLNETITEAISGINTAFNVSYDYFSSGNHNITLIIEDERFSQTKWEWNTSITNLNRPPQLINNLVNKTINTTITINNYFSYGNSKQYFYDPDEDLNEDGKRSVLFSENTSLTYSLTTGYNCSIVSLSYNGDDLTIVPHEEGTCLVKFTATDSYGESVDSNILWLIVTDVVAEEIEVQSPSSGGGGSSRTRTRFIPFPFEVPEEYPAPLDLIVPEEITIYENQTVEIPIRLENKWNNTMEGITLTAESSLNHTSHFSEDYFESLPVGTNATTTLFVDQYRLDSPYSVTITATVDTPTFNDSVVVMINALEKKDDGENIESRVTFARDILNDNPECQELNELLIKAEDEYDNGNREQSIKLINTVVQGCKHLINEKQKVENEQPKSFYSLSEYINKNLPASIILGSIILIITGFGVAMLLTGKSKKADEE